jgi:hypothetical protein
MKLNEDWCGEWRSKQTDRGDTCLRFERLSAASIYPMPTATEVMAVANAPPSA